MERFNLKVNYRQGKREQKRMKRILESELGIIKMCKSGTIRWLCNVVKFILLKLLHLIHVIDKVEYFCGTCQGGGEATEGIITKDY